MAPMLVAMSERAVSGRLRGHPVRSGRGGQRRGAGVDTRLLRGERVAGRRKPRCLRGATWRPARVFRSHGFLGSSGRCAGHRQGRVPWAATAGDLRGWLRGTLPVPGRVPSGDHGVVLYARPGTRARRRCGICGRRCGGYDRGSGWSGPMGWIRIRRCCMGQAAPSRLLASRRRTPGQVQGWWDAARGAPARERRQGRASERRPVVVAGQAADRAR